MPSRGFQVLAASALPPGIAISISTSPVPPCSRATSATAWRIIACGAGLIAGSPTGTGSPGRVTVPTPSPAVKRTPLPGGARLTLQTTSAKWVTSGSSPASLTMPARAKSGPQSSHAKAKAGRSPPGSATVTGSGNSPVRSAVYAARVAPAAQAPVVQPRRKGRSGLRAIVAFYRAAPVAG